MVAKTAFGASRRVLQLVLGLSSFLFFSCLAIDADIEVKADGSGVMNLSYRISRTVESMGKLDGNERWLPLPVGEADFERSLSRIGALELEAFKTTEDERDVRVEAMVSFDTVEALVSFLSANGRTARLTRDGDRTSLSLRLSDNAGPLDSDLVELVKVLFADYDIRIRFQTPTRLSSSGVSLVTEDERQVVFQAPASDILTSTEEIMWTLAW